jgi:hypothetical protein
MLTSRKPTPLSLSSMYKIISSFLKKDINSIFVEILSAYSCSNEDKNRIFTILKNSKLSNYYFLDKCLFIIKDKDSFIKTIKKTINGSVNQGTNKLKMGQTNSLIYTLSIIDHNFRNSLRWHNRYHYEMNNITKDDLIPNSKFTYKNIHINMGRIQF